MLGAAPVVQVGAAGVSLVWCLKRGVVHLSVFGISSPGGYPWKQWQGRGEIAGDTLHPEEVEDVNHSLCGTPEGPHPQVDSLLC